MRLIFIRHAEPDYEHDSLTEKGWREAKLLAVRTKSWQIDDFYGFPARPRAGYRVLYAAGAGKDCSGHGLAA